MRVAVLGCGTIGRGVVEMLLSGVKGMELAKILDRTDKFFPEFDGYYTDDFNVILNDDSIDTIVETMGGRTFSYTCARSALERGKNVVTANKELIAYHLKELTALSEQKNVYLLFEASVGGGIPFIKTLSSLSQINMTSSILGILNGTTNYILTKMQKGGLSYKEALDGARKLGYAEADPRADVEGHDLARKIAILSMIAFKQEIAVDSIYTFPMSGITKDFIEFVSQKDLVLRYACFAGVGENLEIGVEPMLFDHSEVIANINYETNFVQFDMQPNDMLTFIGKGAGRMPTASAIVSDLQVVRDRGQKMYFENRYNQNVALNSKIVSAVVSKSGKIQMVKNISAKDVREGGYDFYAIVYEN